MESKHFGQLGLQDSADVLKKDYKENPVTLKI